MMLNMMMLSRASYFYTLKWLFQGHNQDCKWRPLHMCCVVSYWALCFIFHLNRCVIYINLCHQWCISRHMLFIKYVYICSDYIIQNYDYKYNGTQQQCIIMKWVFFQASLWYILSTSNNQAFYSHNSQFLLQYLINLWNNMLIILCFSVLHGLPTPKVFSKDTSKFNFGYQKCWNRCPF